MHSTNKLTDAMSQVSVMKGRNIAKSYPAKRDDFSPKLKMAIKVASHPINLVCGGAAVRLPATAF